MPVKKGKTKKATRSKKTVAKKQSCLSIGSAILMQTNSLMMLAAAMIAPFYALFIMDMGGSLMRASVVWSVFGAATAITMILTSEFKTLDYQRDAYIVIGYLLVALGFLSLMAVESFSQIIIIQILFGIGHGFSTPMFREICAKHYKPTDGHDAWHVINYFMLAVGTLVAGLIITSFGYTMLFALLALVCSASALYFYSHAREL